MKLFAHWKDKKWELDIEREGEWLKVRCEGKTVELRFDGSGHAIRSTLFDSRKLDFGWTRKNGTYQIVMDGAPYEVTVKDARSERVDELREAAGGPDGAQVRAPIPGLIRRVFVKRGDKVRKEQPLLTLDAMKMENEICSPVDGTVETIDVGEGQNVDKDQTLVTLS
jgi:biotin carboxyl carrier protein